MIGQQLPQAKDVKFLGLDLDRRVTRKKISPNRKELGLKPKKRCVLSYLSLISVMLFYDNREPTKNAIQYCLKLIGKNTHGVGAMISHGG